MMAALACLLGAAGAAQAEPGVRRVVEDFERPVWAGMPGGMDGKRWVMEQVGRVWVVDLAK